MAQLIHGSSNKSDTQLGLMTQDSCASVEVGVHWRGIDCLYNDWLYLPCFRCAVDRLPAKLQSRLAGLKAGDLLTCHFNPTELIPRWRNDHVYRVRRDQFLPQLTETIKISPALGRYYPASWFVIDTRAQDGASRSGRILSIDKQQMRVDFNHPLADKSFDITIRIESVHPSDSEDKRPPEDIIALLLNHGPGLQDRLPEQETDFWQDNPFHRLDPAPDSAFFAQPSFQPFWDETALLQVSHFYQQQIPSHSRILDLMAGIHSPLAEAAIQPVTVSCAGLNRQELENNPQCDSVEVLDVNRTKTLPYADASFDVVLIHAAIEYVIHPQTLLVEILRILKPGGQLIISFSNRYVLEKVIRCWRLAHDFERPGILLAYLRKTAEFGQFISQSWRGRPRPLDDRLASQLPFSDPVFIVSARKTGDS